MRWCSTVRAVPLVLALASGASAQPRRVLLLYDERTDFPGLAILDARLVKTLTDGSPGTVEVYREAMDLSRFQSDSYPVLLRDHFRAKYAAKQIDVVIAVMGPALDFVLAHGATAFPGASIVFCGIDRRDVANRTLPPNATGVIVTREFGPTLRQALKLHPGTKRVLFVAGSSEFDLMLAEAARLEFQSQARDVPVEYLIGLPVRELLDTLATLPPRTVVLYSTMLRDRAGEPFVPHDVAERIATTANAPVYAFVDQLVGRGIVGGHLYSIDAHGEEAARLALRILAGERPSAIPPVDQPVSVDMFDWRQLKRWGIDESRLPAGSVIRFRDLSTWENHKTTILTIAGVLLVQLALILALLLERRVRRRAQTALQESEARAEIAGVSLGVGFWTWEPERDRIWISEPCARLLELERGTQATLATFLDAVRPRTGGPLDHEFEQAIRRGEPFDGEWAVVGRNGKTRWLAVAIRANEEVNGKRRVSGALIDVTERRSAELLAEEQRRELSHLGRVAVVGELSSALAHELNQPLAAILANARAGRRLLENDGVEKAELRAILEDIEADDRRAGEVIKRVRGFVKKDGGQLQRLDINDVVQEVLELAHSDLIHRGVVAQTRLSPQLPVVYADRVQVQQVLLNLIMNACDAMSDSSPGDRALIVSTTVHDSAARISVCDNGGGIAPDSLESVFEPFVTTKRNGLGLGLAICRSIVASHAGEMWATNNPDRGATLIVSLPLVAKTETVVSEYRLPSSVTAGARPSVPAS